MNRFSTADKLNKTRPVAPAKAGLGSGFGTSGGFDGHVGAAASSSSQQSYKDQLLSVILQNTANGSFQNSPSSLASSASAEHLSRDSPPSSQQFAEEPNGNMKSKDFGNGEGELDMLFGFFVMNGACIVFFLLFGVCVICNCAARKPKFHGSEQKEKKRKKPTVSRLVAAMAPASFGGQKNKPGAAVGKQEQNGGTTTSSTNIPMLQANSTGSRRGSTASIRLDQNGNGEGGSPLIANHSPTPRSFRSLVAKAMASTRSGSPLKGGSLAVNIDSDADSQPDPPPPSSDHQGRRQSREAIAHSGGNSPARRMSALSSAIEESSRRVSKLSHCSANASEQPTTASNGPGGGQQRQQRKGPSFVPTLAELEDEEVIFL